MLYEPRASCRGVSRAMGGLVESRSAVSVPVSVDAVRTVEDVEMVRAVFFVAAITDASPATVLPSATRTAAGVPVLLLGGLGVIHRPLTGGDQFGHVDDVVELFAQLDTDASLIEFEDVWLPVAWLAARHAPERGDVYRIAETVFRAAYRYRVATLSLADLLATQVEVGDVAYSPQETRVLREWSARQIADARRMYPKDPRRALAYTDQPPALPGGAGDE